MFFTTGLMDHKYKSLNWGKFIFFIIVSLLIVLYNPFNFFFTRLYSVFTAKLYISISLFMIVLILLDLVLRLVLLILAGNQKFNIPSFSPKFVRQ